MYLLVRGPSGLCWVGLSCPWVRVDPGGGSPRPWEKQGLRLGLGVLALAPESGYVPLVEGSWWPMLGWPKLAHGLGLILGEVAPGHGKSRG